MHPIHSYHPTTEKSQRLPVIGIMLLMQIESCDERMTNGDSGPVVGSATIPFVSLRRLEMLLRGIGGPSFDPTVV